MARKPTYPKDSPVAPATPAAAATAGTDGPVAAVPVPPAPAAPTAPPAAPAGDPKRTKHLRAGAAIGIGSAAIVAALLYANRRNKS